MNRTKPTESKRDERGVSETLGVILMFGLLVAALTIVQVNAVPTQNAKVEYEHDQTARTDFQEVRTAIIETAGADEPRSASVDLGVTYPGRLLFLNPGPVNGRLQTVDAGAYDITDAESTPVDLQQLCGIDNTDVTGVPTKALEYDIDYHVYSGDAVHQYENTVVHQQSGTNGAYVVHNDQQIIHDSTISLYPLVGDVQYSGTAGQSIDFVSEGTSVATRSFEFPWTLSIPTALDASTWAQTQELLLGEPRVVGVSDAGNGIVDIEMAAGTYDFRCTIVGVNETPDGVTPIDDSDDTGTETEINPNEPEGSLVLSAVERAKNDPTYTLRFTNTGTVPLSIEDARLNFFYTARPAQSSDAPTSARFDPSGSNELLIVRGQYADVSPDFIVQPGDTRPVEVTFYTDDLGVAGNEYTPPNSDNFFVLSTHVNGEHALYFVSVGETPTGGAGAGTTAADVSLESASTVAGANDRVEFVVSTVGASTATITGVSIDGVSGNQGPDELRRTATMEFTDGNGNGYDGVMAVGDSYPFVTGSEIGVADGSQVTVTMGDFERVTGNNVNAVDMTGRDVTLTLSFADGSAAQYVLSL